MRMAFLLKFSFVSNLSQFFVGTIISSLTVSSFSRLPSNVWLELRICWNNCNLTFGFVNSDWAKFVNLASKPMTDERDKFWYHPICSFGMSSL